MINKHLILGTINRLLIDRDTEPGLYLVSEDEKDVLLPNRYVTENMKIGDSVDVFLHTDSEDRLVAITQKPYAMLGEFAYMEVVDTTDFGAFVDWGIPKDLFIPRIKQKKPFKIGQKRIIYVAYDEQTHRLIGTEQITKNLTNETAHLNRFSQVNVLVMAKTPLGYKVIVENRHEGMLYHNEIFEPIGVGDKKNAYIKTIREDGKLDLSLRPIGKLAGAEIEVKIMNLIKSNSGYLPYNYKSNAVEIKEVFGLSKKEFKRTLTSLIEKKLIFLEKSGIICIKC